MNLEVGMYVRTKDRGIAKFMGWSAYDENKVAIHTHNEGDIEITPVIDKNTIIKASNNIIDLIEVGDYVNGHKVTKLGFDKLFLNCKTIECHQEDLSKGYEGVTFVYTNKDIKSIVTKEQFESMKYSLEG